MAVLKYKTQNGQYASLVNYNVQPITPVQTTGTSATDIMSQNAVTTELNKKITPSEVQTKITDATTSLISKTDAYTAIYGQATKPSGVTNVTSSNFSTQVTSDATVSKLVTEDTRNSGHKNVTSISAIPIDKRLVFCTISAGGSFGLASTPADGKEVHIIVKNSSTAQITITIPNNGTYVNMDGMDGSSSLTIGPSYYADINVVSDGSKMYVRAV